jgi:hypothetical protein
MILSHCSCEQLGVILAHGTEAPMDLLINLVLTASSVALFCYWFRYGCLLILAAETLRDYSEEVVSANQLTFPAVQSELRRHDAVDLDGLHKCLERDFTIIACLLEGTSISTFDTGFEDAMLKMHFRAMSACFRLTRSNLREFALDALEEMTLVVAHFANQLGERDATFASGCGLK